MGSATDSKESLDGEGLLLKVIKGNWEILCKRCNLVKGFGVHWELQIYLRDGQRNDHPFFPSSWSTVLVSEVSDMAVQSPLSGRGSV